MAYPYILQGDNLVVVIDSTPHTLSKGNVTYNKVLDAIKQNDWDAVRDFIEPKKVVLNYGKGNVSIKGETLYWKDQEFNSALSTRMISMLTEGFPIEPLVLFMENLMQNPSKRSVTELYRFLEKNTLPITPDGHFLAYKKVRADYTDVHTGTFDNSVGKIVEMERNQVDDDKDRTCSQGLHFCSESYLKSFGGERTMILKVNPRDVVSIPSDYNDAKGRCCRYEVVGELAVSADKAFDKPVQENANGSTPVKKGTSPFYAGYDQGYHGKKYNPPFTGRDLDDFEEGVSKGMAHRQQGLAARYEFESWPFPVNPWAK